MLITGDIDNNVHPANTLRMVDALIKANKRFDLRTGKPLTLPAFVPIDTFPVSVEDGVIKLEVD